MALGSITLVTVPVTDQDRALAFYVDKLEFTPTSEDLMGAKAAAGDGARWRRLTPPGGGADVTLVTWFAGVTPPGSVTLAMSCADVDTTYAELAARGVTPTSEVTDAPWGRWFGIEDPDGNAWLIVQAR